MILRAICEAMARKEFSLFGLLCIASIVVMTALPASATSAATISDLRSMISSFDDPNMNEKDLAFYLATHNFDARPMNGYVDVCLGDNILRLTPNGAAPGLCTISID